MVHHTNSTNLSVHHERHSRSLSSVSLLHARHRRPQTDRGYLTAHAWRRIVVIELSSNQLSLWQDRLPKRWSARAGKCLRPFDGAAEIARRLCHLGDVLLHHPLSNRLRCRVVVQLLTTMTMDKQWIASIAHLFQFGIFYTLTQSISNLHRGGIDKCYHR